MSQSAAAGCCCGSGCGSGGGGGDCLLLVARFLLLREAVESCEEGILKGLPMQKRPGGGRVKVEDVSMWLGREHISTQLLFKTVVAQHIVKSSPLTLSHTGDLVFSPV